MPNRQPGDISTDDDWVRGYARQAISDLTAREVLARNRVEKCHRLHFLQMAAEKTCKAYLTAANGHGNVRNTHAYVADVLPIIARHFYSALNTNAEIARWRIEEIKRLAREIELLAPACSEGETRRDNSEYPWEDAHGTVCIPCEYKFSNIDDGSPSIVGLIKLIRTAAESYVKKTN